MLLFCKYWLKLNIPIMIIPVYLTRSFAPPVLWRELQSLFGGNHHCCPVCQPEAACQLEREEGYLRGGMIEEDGDRTNCVMCCVCVCREKTGSFSIPHSCFMHTGMSPGFNYRGSNWSRCVSVCVLVHAHTHYIYPFSPSTCKLHAFGPCGDSVSAKQLCMLMVMWLWLADTF